MFHPSDQIFTRSPRRRPVIQIHGDLWALLFAISYFLCALTRSPLLAADAPETTLPKLSDEARSAAAKGLSDFQNQKIRRRENGISKNDRPRSRPSDGMAQPRRGGVSAWGSCPRGA